MLGRRTPASLLDQQASALRAQLQGVYDGSTDAVHDARVATRRIRELLALIPSIPGRDDKDVGSQYKQIGRALGKVRDADVQVALIRSLEAHAPQAAPSLVIVRQQHERDRQSKMRRLIKALERVEVESLLHAITNSRPAGLRTRLTANGWRHQLRRLMVARAHDANDAIDHATGVYFPNRVHSARIAIKRLRYAAEIAQATRLSDLNSAIKQLRKGQEILGDLHDRQVLAETLTGYTHREETALPHLTLTIQVLESDIAESHTAYLERRERLYDASSDIKHAASRATPSGRTVAVGSAIAASGLYCVRLALSAVSHEPTAREREDSPLNPARIAYGVRAARRTS